MTVAATNTFERFWALGYQRLVPIIPPDAAISERSSFFKRINTPRDPRGKAPGVRRQDGNWSGFDWIPYEADTHDIARWHEMGAGVGLKMGAGLVAIDADTLDEDQARVIRDMVIARFGELPVRVGRYPKALYLCRIDGPLRYMRVEFGQRDEKGRLQDRVEILTEGRQAVVHGIHPKTRQPYRWPQSLPPLAELKVFPASAIVDLLNDLAKVLPAAKPPTTEGAPATVSQESLRGDLDVVREAVNCIPNTSDLFPVRESYLAMGFAIKASLPLDEPAAFDLYADWCARWQDGHNDLDIARADWSRMKPPFKRGANWLYELAEAHGGGRFDRAKAWFQPVPPDDDNPFAALDAERTPTDIYPVLGIDEILNRPPPTWLVERHIPERATGFLYSDPGVGKTFIALDVALHIAYGRAQWHGDAITAPDGAQVLYLAAEGSYGFRNRIKAWCQKHGVTESTDRFKMIETSINFMSPEDVQKLLRTVRAAVGAGVVLIVVDTVSRAMPGADENLQKDMTLFVVACDALRLATGATVLGVHHAGKSGDMRGSTVLRGAGDFVFRLERRKGSSIGTLECEKMKDAPDGWSEPYRFDHVTLEDGETSLVVERAEMSAGPAVELTPTLAGLVLDAMRAAWDAGEPWSRAPQAGERRATRRMALDFGFDATAAADLLTLWQQTGVIEVGQVSSTSKKRGYRVLAAPAEGASVGVFD